MSLASLGRLAEQRRGLDRQSRLERLRRTPIDPKVAEELAELGARSSKVTVGELDQWADYLRRVVDYQIR